MQDFLNFFSGLTDVFTDFLLSPPISYIFGCLCVLLVLGLFRRLMRM